MSVGRVGGIGGSRVDTRIIAATNQPLSELVARGRFRLDLFYRLHGVDSWCRPCVSGRTTSWSSPSTCSSDIATSGGSVCRRLPRTRRSRIAGRATCGKRAWRSGRWGKRQTAIARVVEAVVTKRAGDRFRLRDYPSALRSNSRTRDSVTAIPRRAQMAGQRGCAARLCRGGAVSAEHQ
jgi:hypothetical protein